MVNRIPVRKLLLISEDVDLLEAVSTLAGAVGLELEARAAYAESEWLDPTLVLVGADLLADVAASMPARRDGVVVVAGCTDDRLWRPALEVGAEHVAFLPIAADWLTTRFAAAVEGPGRAGTLIGVVAGCGGAGASTFAAGLATAAAARRLVTMLVDLDPVGGGPELLLGAEREPGRSWSDLQAVRGRIGADVLAGSLPSAHGVRLLSWGRGPAAPLPPAAVDVVLDAAARSHDLVVVDLPRQFDAAGKAALTRLDRVFVLVTNELRASAAATRVVASLGPVPAAVVVRRRPGGLAALDVAELIGLPLAADLRSDSELVAVAERGDSPMQRRGPLRELCRRISEGIADDRAA